MISSKRLTDNFSKMAAFSTTAGSAGITRLAFSDSDWQGRDFIISRMEEAGLTVHSDSFGNVIGRLEGTDPKLPAVMLGSHADSVPNGGNYDGVTGILAAIEVINSLRDSGFKNENPLEVVLFMCEESSRFGAATLGSRAMRGQLSSDDMHRLHDKTGRTLYTILKDRGLQPDNIADAQYIRPLKAFFEVHIEQGKVLEHNNIPLGIVTGIAAPTRMLVHLHGSADHSGATPMELRHDGMCAAAAITLAVEAAAKAHTDPPVVGTVGIVNVQPGVMNVIPGEVELGIDIRSISSAAKAAVTDAVQTAIADICRQRTIPYDLELISDELPSAMLPEMLTFLEKICTAQHKPYLKMPSGAGHDAMHWTDYTPTGMLFIPCRNGISHNPAEFAALTDIMNVTEVLEATIRTVSQKSFSFK